MNNAFLYSHWIGLPLSTRALIAQKFGIAKVSSTHVVGNEVVSDGYKIQDVEHVLSSEAVKEYVGVDAAPAEFVALLAAKIQEPEALVVPEEVVEAARKQPSILAAKPKKVTKRKK